MYVHVYTTMQHQYYIKVLHVHARSRIKIDDIGAVDDEVPLSSNNINTVNDAEVTGVSYMDKLSSPRLESPAHALANANLSL